MVVKIWWWKFDGEILMEIWWSKNGGGHLAKKNLDAKYFREAMEILMPQLLVTGSLVSTHPLPGNSQAVLTLLQNRSETPPKKSAAKKSSEQGIPGWGLLRRRGIAHKIRHAVLQPGARSRGPGWLYRGRCAGGGQRSIYTVSGQTLDLMHNIAIGQVDKQKTY